MSDGDRRNYIRDVLVLMSGKDLGKTIRCLLVANAARNPEKKLPPLIHPISVPIADKLKVVAHKLECRRGDPHLSEELGMLLVEQQKEKFEKLMETSLLPRLHKGFFETMDLNHTHHFTYLVFVTDLLFEYVKQDVYHHPDDGTYDAARHPLIQEALQKTMDKFEADMETVHGHVVDCKMRDRNSEYAQCVLEITHDCFLHQCGLKWARR